MGKTKKIHISIKTFKRLGDKQKCKALIDLLFRNNLVPLKYDTSEGTRFKFEEDAFIKFWVDMEEKRGFGIPFIKGEGYNASFSWGGAKPYFAWFTISLGVLSTTDSILNFTKNIFEWSESCYGYATFDDYSKKLYTPGMNIMDCLGDITWANFFGKPYVDMWGEEKLINAPTWRTERLNDGGFLLVTTESPLVEQKIAEKYEEKLKKHLGSNYFCRKPIPQETLTYQELLEKVANPPPIVGYKAPDFSRYIDT